MVVTATRTEKRDVDVPASTTVITSKQLENSGSNSIAEVLGKQAGIEYKSFGPLGTSMGTMINEVNIRGISNGTLVLVNGNPISWRGKYNLESIPTDSIERIEIVKSGGSVLYGSEAMGGVVNIITKKKGSNKISVGYGNRSHQNYRVNVGDEKFTAGYSLEKMGRVNYRSISDVNYPSKKPVLKGKTRTDADDIKKQSVNLGYNFNDRLSLAYNYYESQVNYERIFVDVEKGDAKIDDQFNGRLYTTKQNNIQLNYKDDDYKASIYYNITNVESEGPTFYNTSTTSGGAKWQISHRGIFSRYKEVCASRCSGKRLFKDRRCGYHGKVCKNWLPYGKKKKKTKKKKKNGAATRGGSRSDMYGLMPL